MLSTANGVAVTPEQQHAKWSKDLDRIKDDLILLNHDRNIWREVTTALSSKSETEHTFAAHYTKMYVHSATSAVRRLADPLGRPETVSISSWL